MPEDMSEYMPEDMPDRMPEDMSDRVPEDMPDRMPEDLPDRMPEDMPDRMPEDLPDRMPEDMPDHMPEDMPDRMSNRMSEDMSDRMPEDLPVRKCINVMVGITRSKVIFLMVSKGLKRSLPSVFSTRFSFDKSLAQILHHRFCIAVRRFLSILPSFLQIASLAFGRNGDSSRILKAFALPPIILDILATYPAIYHERIWIWSTEKHFWASSVVLACSLDPTKIGGPFNNLTVVHKIQRNLQTTAAHDTRLVAIEPETWTK